MKCVDTFKVKINEYEIVMRVYVNVNLDSKYNSIGIYVLESDYSGSIIDLKSFGNTYPSTALREIKEELENSEEWKLSKTEDIEIVKSFIKEYLKFLSFMFDNNIELYEGDD